MRKPQTLAVLVACQALLAVPSHANGTDTSAPEDPAVATLKHILAVDLPVPSLKERVELPGASGRLVREDRSDLVARIRFGKANWHGFVDAGAARARTAGAANESVRRIGPGAQYQLREDIWLVVGAVRETGFATGGRHLVNTGLRFGQADAAQIGNPGEPKQTQ